ncbi:MAG: glycosyltransferase, partial [Gemmatimonadetes bacterium]|nr:glycosyltransferase [Gemmatimonadota bacterium]
MKRILDAWRRGGFSSVRNAAVRQLRLREYRGLTPEREYARWRAVQLGPPAAGPPPGRWLILAIGFPAPPDAAEMGLPDGEIRVWSGSADPPDGNATSAWPEARPGEQVLGLGPGERLLPDALHRLADPTDATLLYGDEEWETPDGVRPLLKPDWSPRLLDTWPAGYPGVPTALAADLWNAVRRHARTWPEAVRAAGDIARRFGHVPVPLVRRRTAPPPPGPEAGPGTSTAPGRAVGSPSLAAIIPTRDRPDLLHRLVPGLLEAQRRHGMRLVFVDHATQDPDALAQLRELAAREGVAVIREEGAFNFSRMINRGLEHVTEDEVLLLNNDVFPTSDAWLDPLRSALQSDRVAAVAPQLRYPDGTLQHAGIGLGIG